MHVKVDYLESNEVATVEFKQAIRCGFMQQTGMFVVESDGKEHMFHPQVIVRIEKDLEKIALSK